MKQYYKDQMKGIEEAQKGPLEISIKDLTSLFIITDLFC